MSATKSLNQRGAVGPTGRRRQGARIWGGDEAHLGDAGNKDAKVRGLRLEISEKRESERLEKRDTILVRIFNFLKQKPRVTYVFFLLKILVRTGRFRSQGTRNRPIKPNFKLNSPASDLYRQSDPPIGLRVRPGGNLRFER